MSAAMPDAIRNHEGERLDVALHDASTAPADRSRPPHVVVIGHGVTSNKDRPWLVELGDALARERLAALRLSFSGNGQSEGRFEDCTLTKEVEDLGSVLDALERSGVRRLAYVGHSMGAAVGVLRAAGDRRISCLVSLAGMVHVHAFMQRHFGRLAPGRDLMLDKPGCRWNRALAEDAARIGSVTRQAALIEVPWLLVHGDADEMVPLGDALDAQAAAPAHAELVTLPGVDHRFTAAMPAVIAAVVPWLARQLESSVVNRQSSTQNPC
jgi:uncharacterized protein